MKTKEKILSKALQLFNSEGLKDVTLRRISGSLGISQGNLNYHYKTRSDIVSELYFQLVEKMDIEMTKMTMEKPILSFLFDSSLISMKILYEYRFITRDLYSVLASSTELKEHYLTLQNIRKQQYLQLFKKLETEDLMRNEEIDGEYDRLYERMNILGDNWINAATLYTAANEAKITHYHALLFEIIYPYLTKKGKQEYLKLI